MSQISMEDSMSIVKKLLIAAATSAALVFPALAAEGEPVQNGTVYVLEPNGTMVQMKFTAAGMKAFTNEKPKVVSKRMFLVMQNGKFYMLEDPRGSLYSQWRDMMIQGGG